jgi:prophage regulatory protein
MQIGKIRMTRKILRQAVVAERVALSVPQIWRLEKAGNFPSRIQISAGAVGWFEDEIDAWIEARPRGFGRRPSHKPAA